MLKKIIILSLYLSIPFYAFSQKVDRELSARDTITDNSIEYPADMEQNYDQLLTEWKKVMKYTDICTGDGQETVLAPDSVYIDRLYSLPTRMEMIFNPVVKQYIEMYAGRRRQQVSYMLNEGKFYFPIFEQALDKAGLPLELKYLPVIESALNPVARSRVGATGLWQFMAGTGRMYKLEISSLVDERRDPQKSTDAAVQYLKDMYNIYGDWNLVIAAYNCGPGNVNKAIRRSGGQRDYWDIYPYLPRETRGYVPAFIAATYIMSYHEEHNICPGGKMSPASMDTLMIDKMLHLQQVADVIDIPLEDLRRFNPQYTNDIVPGAYKEYALKLPNEKVSAFIDNQDTIYTHRSQELLTHRKVGGVNSTRGTSASGKSLTYRVKKGDTLGGIASKHGISVNQLKQWNGLKSTNISIGHLLKVSNAAPVAKQEVKKKSPQLTEAKAVVAEPQIEKKEEFKGNVRFVTTKRIEPVTSFYKIKSGDNLQAIAQRQGVDASELKTWNNLRSNNLTAGKSLKVIKMIETVVVDTVEIPEPQLAQLRFDSVYSVHVMADCLKTKFKNVAYPRIILNEYTNAELDRANGENGRLIYHKVRIGETIPQIATRYNVDRDDIMEWNNLSSKVAKVGQRLMIYLPDEAHDKSEA